MINLLLSLLLTMLVGYGYGEKLNKLFNLNNSFSLPIGFVLFLTLLQIFYYPVQYFNLSFNYIIIISVIVYGIGLVLFVRYFKSIIKQILSINTIWLMLSFITFIVVYYYCFIDIDFSDSQMYINYISQNVNIDKLNMFHLYTGVTGSEWETIYLYQGYYHFGSFLVWLTNIPYYLFNASESVANITIITWGLGIIYSLVSSTFFINMINYLDVKDKLFKNSLLLFTLLYSNFYYWRVALSFYGNTFRTLFITMLMFYIYRWIKENKEEYKFIIIIILFAGLAVSSSFLFISFGVMIALTIYLFINKKDNAFIDMSYLVIPILIYGVVIFSKDSMLIAIALLLLSIIYYIGINFKLFKNIISVIERFIFKYAKVIFYIIVPIILVIISIYVNVTQTDFLYGFDFWFKDHRKVDMVLDYTFVYSSLLTFILNIFRWYGVYLVLREKGNGYIKVTFIVMLLLFLNPLVSTAISYTIASNVFYRLVEVMFNPFTEAILFIYIVNKFEGKKLVKVLCCFVMIFVTSFNHACSFLGNDIGHYSFYIEGGKKSMPLYKVTWYEYDVIQKYMNEIKGDGDSKTILSHTDALRSFSPSTKQIFTARDYYYQYTQIDWNFYSIAKNMFDWEEERDANFHHACMYIERYEVDYVILKHNLAGKFDKGSDMCTYTIYENDVYKLKGVIDDPNIIEYERNDY